MSDLHEKELEVIGNVFKLCADNPKFLSRVIEAGVSGIQEMASHESQRAADMETVAAVALGLVSDGKKITAKTKKYMEELAGSKLEKYHGKTSCNWKWAINGDEE